MYEIECGLQVYVQNSIPLLLSHAQHQSVFRDSCIVDQYIYTSKIFFYLIYHLLSLRKVGCIACISTACNTKTFYFFTSSLKSCLHFIVKHQIGKGDVSTFARKFQSNGLSYAACRTCNQSGLSFE